MSLRSADFEREMPIGSVEQIYVRLMGRNLWVSNLETAKHAIRNRVNWTERGKWGKAMLVRTENFVRSRYSTLSFSSARNLHHFACCGVTRITACISLNFDRITSCPTNLSAYLSLIAISSVP
jgi:hypothetical protein